jgi:hypothetical protein
VTTRNLYSDCPELLALLKRCGSEDPDPEVLAELESHIEACGLCRDAEALISNTAASLRTYGDNRISQEFEERLVDQLCGKNPD